MRRCLIWPAMLTSNHQAQKMKDTPFAYRCTSETCQAPIQRGVKLTPSASKSVK